MGPSRKRKELPPNCTLLDFFSNADAIKRARVRTSQQSPPRAQQAMMASRDIIVIDSDSDDGLHMGNGERGTRSDPKAEGSEDACSLNSVASTLTCPEDKDDFGVPSALLRPPHPPIRVSRSGFHVQQKSTTSPKINHAECVFGSAPLLEQPPTSSCFWAFCVVRNSLILS